MGLDISAHSKATKTDLTNDQFEDDTNLYKDHDWIHVGGDFPERASDLTDGVYKIEGESHDFRAGAYSTYNNLRDRLAMIAGYPKSEGNGRGYDTGAWEADSGPFWEMITFSDCEGVIGPKVSEKLYSDFVEYEGKIKDEDERFKEFYADFKRAFELAKDGGFVDFH